MRELLNLFNREGRGNIRIISLLKEKTKSYVRIKSGRKLLNFFKIKFI